MRIKFRLNSDFTKNIFLVLLLVLSSINIISAECHSQDTFKCHNGECISKREQCDKKDDCSDGSDEFNCGDSDCHGPKYWRCDSGLCIESTLKCNDYIDCPDGSDEKHCLDDFKQDISCSQDEFDCNDGTCITKDMICNGIGDCFDHIDEKDCSSNSTCKGFLCDNKHCIIKQWTCDGHDDCGDESDERNCSHLVKMEDCKVEDGYFPCKDKSECLFLENVCDNTRQCNDGSDEGGYCNDYKHNCVSANCTHHCVNTPQGYFCYCPQGFEKLNHHTCEDIDECTLLHNNCSQHCENHPGSYTCRCDKGFELQKDEKTCKVKEGDPIMVFTTNHYIKIYNIRTKKLENFAELKKSQPTAVEYDGKYIYWSNINTGHESIVRSLKDKYSPEILVNNGVGLVEDIAIDWLTGNIYFTDIENAQIAACTNDGLHCSVLISKKINKPRSIALHPTRGEMYWSDWGNKPQIGKAYMDGTNMIEFVNTNIRWPNGICIDYPNDKLYWVDASFNTIESISLNGKNRKTIMEYYHHPYNIALFEDSIYWSDWKMNNTQLCDKFTGKNDELLIHSDRIFGLHIYHPAYKTEKHHSCESNPCEFICLLKGNNSYTCACPEDKILKADRRSCEDSPLKNELVAGVGNSLIWINHQSIGKTVLSETILEITSIDSLVYDSQHDRIIIYDYMENVISAVSANRQSKIETLVKDDMGSVVKLEIDEYANNLYWCDVSLRTIEVLSLNTYIRSVILSEDNDHKPIDMALVSKKGFMFVAFKTQSNHVYISRISMDGNGPRIIVLEYGYNENKVSIYADVDEEMLYVAGLISGRIEKVHFNGNQKITLNTIIPHSVSLTGLGGEIFLSSNGYIFWISKNATEHFMIPKQLEIDGSSQRLMHLTSVSNKASLEKKYSFFKHPCSLSPSPCSHLCVQVENEDVFNIHHINDFNTNYTCRCPVGMIIDTDKRTCIKQVHCEENQFLCFKSNICVDLNRECNGQIDCPKGEDEIKCGDRTKKCNPDQYKCINGECIPIEFRCDQHYDCFDSSDEANCTDYEGESKMKCSKAEFECRKGKCIPQSLVCDEHVDCPQGDDEEHCQQKTCSHKEFRCLSGKCIDKNLVCDGEADCPDNSDEHENCPSNTVCSHNMFHCRNGRCIDEKLFCDFNDDCGDSSDEENCPDNKSKEDQCHEGEFKCVSENMCLPKSSKCNGIPECLGAEDESDCHHPSCRPGVDFSCNNGRCIPMELICDGTSDCSDSSDENTILCKRKGENKFQIILPIINETLAVDQECKNSYKCNGGQCLEYKYLCDGFSNCRDGSDEGGSCNTSCQSSVCSFGCIKSPKGSICSCPHDMELAENGLTCLIPPPPCSKNHELCDHICVNMESSFICKCYEGYVLRPDRKSCKALGDPVSVIFHVNGDIRKMSLRNNSIKVVHKENSAKITGLDVFSKSDAIFYSVAELGQLHHLNMTTNTEYVVYKIGKPTLIAVDWITENVYFVDDADSQKWIVVCHIDKQKCANLIQLDSDITVIEFLVDPVNGVMFYTTLTQSITEKQLSIIYKANLDGTDTRVLFKDNELHCSGLAIDYNRKILYFSDIKANTIESINYEGTRRNIIFEKNDYIHKPTHLDLFEEDIFSLSASTNKITRCKLIEPKKCRSFTLHGYGPSIFKILQISKQRPMKNPCIDINCSHLCVTTPMKPVCICENGLREIFNGECSKPVNFRTPIFSKSQEENRVMKKANGTGVVVITVVGFIIIFVAVMIAIYMKCLKKIKRQLPNLNYSVHFQNPSFRGGLPLFNPSWINNVNSKCPKIIKTQQNECENILSSKINDTQWFLSEPDVKHVEMMKKISGCQLQVPNILADTDSDVESDRDFHDHDHKEKVKLLS